MELEQQRGISITSTVLQFPYRDCVVNLLDTPGHRDFSEDTYRVLAAADAAIMVLDAAKGIEPQTLKLFEVCRARGMPLLTFINKWDRPGREAARAARRDRGADRRHAHAGHVAGRHRRRLPRRRRPPRRRASSASPGRRAARRGARGDRRPASAPPRRKATAWAAGHDELELLDGIGAARRGARSSAGEPTPTFFGSALTNFGVRLLLDAVIDLAPPPSARPDDDGKPRPLDAPFSGFVFKVQANMDPSHRDRIAFLRVCSGRFERGMVVTHGPHRQAVRHQVRPPGVRPGARDGRGGLPRRRRRAWSTPPTCGSATRSTSVEPVTFPPIPSFAPEHFAVARVRDTGRFKQFRKGIAQLDEEGVVQVLRDPDLGDQAPMLAAVGPMQFEVAIVPPRARVRRAGRAEPDRRTRSPAAPTRPAGRGCGRCAASTSWSGPTAPCSRCSRAPTGSTGSWPSSRISPWRSWWQKERFGSERRPTGDRRPDGRAAVGPHPGGSAGADPVAFREQRKARLARRHRTAGVTMVLLGIAVVVVALVSWWSVHDDSAPPKTGVSGVSITAPSTVPSTIPPTIPSTTQPTSNP